mgnify:CR=1 FL=1
MTLNDKLKRIRGVSSTNYWAQRIYAELCYMACLSSTKEHIYDARLEMAADELLARYPEGVYVVGDCVKSARMLGDANNEAFHAAISIR